MTAQSNTSITAPDPLEAAIELACSAIAPNWPLDRLIAVSPYWHSTKNTFAKAHKVLHELAGSRLTMPGSYYHDAWNRGEITKKDVTAALLETQNSADFTTALEALNQNSTKPYTKTLLSDHIDRNRDLLHEPSWDSVITHQISQFCAAYFDRDQADWHLTTEKSLYATWKDIIQQDHGVALLMHAPFIQQRAQHLPVNAYDLIQFVLNKLDVHTSDTTDFLQVVLMRINGWASWCAYLRWQASLNNSEDHHISDLLAIRLAWEYLVDDGNRETESAWVKWRQRWDQYSKHAKTRNSDVLLVWQRAHEIAYQRKLAKLFLGHKPVARTETPHVQAVFCIDVRSEVLRRALEEESAQIQTVGFAGFFGLPIQYSPIGTHAARPQLPGLLAPAMNVTDSCGDIYKDYEIATRRSKRLQRKKVVKPFKRLPASSFSLVESLGLTYLGKLIQRNISSVSTHAINAYISGLSAAEQHILHPQLTLIDDEHYRQRAQLVAQTLKGMSLTEDFARLVLLVGHGSHSANNPLAAGLDCGACCGQTGEVNARVLAALLNDSNVRFALQDQGILIPQSSYFMAALHNTSTDEVTLFDIDSAPDTHADDIGQLQTHLRKAGEKARLERAASLGLADHCEQPAKLSKLIQARSKDWSQLRPEWGLSNNAAFIIAPRERTRGINLQGRSFLHEYDPQKDTDGSILEQIITAPMMVTHWINMQYFSSTVDNQLYGSGNKVLHNVVGGRIGVFEGNGGDLRIGLPKQSLHNGSEWMHAPLRLSVIIDAPREAIAHIIIKHEKVFQLVHNKWLHLYRLENAQLEYYQHGEWKLFTP